MQLPLLSVALTIVSLLVAVYALRRWRLRHTRATVGTGALLLWCGAFWMLTNALEMASQDASLAGLWERVQYFGIVPVPTLWLYMALQFTGRERLMTRARLALLNIIPVTCLVAAMTAEHHALFLTNVRLVSSGPFVNVIGDPGPILVIAYVYGYIEVAAGTFLFVQNLLRSKGVRWQGSIVLLGVALAVVANILDWSRLSPFPYIKLTPVGLIIAIPLFVFTLTRARRADIVPIARSAVIQTMQDAVLVLDRESRVIDMNPAAQDIFRQTLSAVFGRVANDVWPQWVQQLESVSLTNRGDNEIRLGDGDQKRVFDVRRSELKDWRGQLISRVVVLRDITKRVRAEEALRLSEEHFRALTENASDIVIIIDRNAMISYASASVERQYGFRAGELSGKSALELIHPDDLHTVLNALTVILSTPGVAAPIIARFAHKEGGWRVFESVANNLLDHPAVRGIVINARDVTERLRAEAQVKASLAEKEVLLKEIHHRVKNNLQIVSSLLSLQFGGLEDPQIVSLFQESQNRIHAMALIHEHLYRSADLARVDFSAYLSDLTTTLVDSYCGRDYGQRVSLKVNADGIRLDIDTAIPCGLIVNELVSNALKHAFPEKRGGVIGVEMSRSTESEYRLLVCDDGVGFPQAAGLQGGSSLGLQLVRSLVRQLNGTLTVESTEGAQILMRFPAPKSARDTAQSALRSDGRSAVNSADTIRA